MEKKNPLKVNTCCDSLIINSDRIINISVVINVYSTDNSLFLLREVSEALFPLYMGVSD